jgi:hypothetical protein
MDTVEKVMAGNDTQQTVQDLNAKWRNYLSDQMNLDKDTFQLAQGSLGVQTSDSMGLFLMADAVPPSSAVGFYDANSMKRRSSAYGMLLGALLPEVGADGMRTALGDWYTPWMTWSATNPVVAGDTLSSRLDRFGLAQAVDPGVIMAAKTAAAQAAGSTLYAAIKAFSDPNQQQAFSLPGQAAPTNLYIYTNTIAVAKAAIQNGASLSINFDSATESSDVSHTFADGAASGFFDIFSGDASASLDQLNSKAASAGFTITGTIGQYATVPVGANSWYNSAEVSRAFNNPDNTVWAASSAAGGHDSFFGQPDGSLARYVSELVLVSAYSITVTSKATYSQDDVATITAKASGGIWPFFSVNGSATHSTEVRLNSNSQLETTFTLNKGLIQIWGVNVQNQN